MRRVLMVPAAIAKRTASDQRCSMRVCLAICAQYIDLVAKNQDLLSLLKIISWRSYDAIRTELACRRWVRIVGQLVVSVGPWPILGACGSHCNKVSLTSAPGANAVRPRSAVCT